MDLTLPGFPTPLHTDHDAAWRLDQAGLLTGSAGPTTDIFVDPTTGAPTLNGPTLLGPTPPGDFQLHARVEVDFAGTYDAGTLVLWADSATWAKLCFEFSPQRQPMVVSVVTRGVSDDANGFIVDGPAVWLRIAGVAGAYTFHASTDGSWWHLIRYFSLGSAAPRPGFGVQSPTGAGLRATFSEIRYEASTLADLRSGD